METNDNLTPFKVTHPGVLIKDEIDAISGLTQKELAMQLGLKPSFLNEVIKGKRPITADLAVLLEKALGISADYWMKFQSQYEIDKARVKEKTALRIKNIEIWNAFKEYVPVNYFKNQGYLSDDVNKNICKIKEIYNVTDIEQLIGNFAFSKNAFYRKSEKLEVDEKNVFAWSALAEYEANKISVSTFNPDNLTHLIAELNNIFYKNENTIEKVKQNLNKYGIVLVLLEKPKKTPIDGYSFWSGNNPVIALTLRHTRIDNFAFTIMHEIGHIELHLLNNKVKKILDIKGNKAACSYETEADDFAKKSLIPNEVWKSIPNYSVIDSRKKVNDKIIVDYAHKAGINPAIILGRICYEREDYALRTRINKKLN